VDDSNDTKEHVFPKWLLNRFDLWELRGELPNDPLRVEARVPSEEQGTRKTKHPECHATTLDVVPLIPLIGRSQRHTGGNCGCSRRSRRSP
jgi:hypothetical protein